MGEYVMHLWFGERDRKSECSIPESLGHGRQLNVCSLNE